MTSEEYNFMNEAVVLADSCDPAFDHIPKVGALITCDGQKIGQGKRGTGKEGDNEHAEHNALLTVQDTTLLASATVYTTLEPCTREVRSRSMECCTEQLLQHRVTKVFIGILDPNQGVRGKGLWELQRHGIQVALFHPALAETLLSMNAKFIRFHQTLGARVVHPPAEQVVDLIRQDDGRWFGKCDLIINCANDPTDSIKVIVQKGSEWWPATGTLHRVGLTREWKSEVYFGAPGDYTIHVVRAFEAGANLVNYYVDVLNRNIERKREANYNLLPELLQALPGHYQGIKMGGLPKGLESQAHVSVKVVPNTVNQHYDRFDIGAIWLRSLLDFGEFFWATNYALPEDVFDQEFGATGLRIQIEKCNKRNKEVKKIFIANDPEEMVTYYELEMTKQTDNGLNVAWIYYTEIWQQEGLKELKDYFQARSIDFQLFDGTRLVIWNLDTKTRRHLGGWKSELKAECEKYHNFFQKLWPKCHPYVPETARNEFDVIFRRVCDA